MIKSYVLLTFDQGFVTCRNTYLKVTVSAKYPITKNDIVTEKSEVDSSDSNPSWHFVLPCFEGVSAEALYELPIVKVQ
jgi:hypothetical protein